MENLVNNYNCLYFLKRCEKEHGTHSRNNNIKFTSYNDANKIVDELGDSLWSRIHGNLKTSMRGSDFIYNSLQLMYFKCHKVNFRRGGWNIDSPDWIKRKKEKSKKYRW